MVLWYTGRGGMAERAIAAVLKTARGKPLGSSNLPPSAKSTLSLQVQEPKPDQDV